METETPGSKEARAPRRTRIATTVTSLDTLVGGHPNALRSIFEKSDPANVEAMLGDLEGQMHGRILSLIPTEGAHMLLRPVIEVISTTLMPWKGVTFDHGGNAGANIVFGRKTMRFRAEQQPSLHDGEPCLALVYPQLLRDELRAIGDGLALGLTFATVGGRSFPIAWFGLSK